MRCQDVFSSAGERERRRHLSRTSHWHVRLQGAGDPVARSPEGRGKKGRGFSVHRRGDGHRHVRGEGVRCASGGCSRPRWNKGTLFTRMDIRIIPVLSNHCSWCRNIYHRHSLIVGPYAITATCHCELKWSPQVCRCLGVSANDITSVDCFWVFFIFPILENEAPRWQNSPSNGPIWSVTYKKPSLLAQHTVKLLLGIICQIFIMNHPRGEPEGMCVQVDLMFRHGTQISNMHETASMLKKK